MLEPARHPREAARQAQLDALAVLDTAAEDRFDDLVHLASDLFNVPIALISLVDRERQWFKARHGLDAPQTERRISLCGHAILQPDVFTVPDAATDARFADNPLVTGDPSIRFYAGVPLVVGDGLPMGTLCLIDRQPRQLTEVEERLLRQLGAMVERELSNQHLRALLASQQQAELALGKALEEARQANRVKSAFLANMSHELRTPLNSVIGFGEMLADESFGALNVDQQDFVATILRNGRHLLHLINDILDLAKVESGKMELVLTPVALPALIAETAASLASLAGAKGLTVDVPEPGPQTVVGDALRLRQVLTNLLSNAIKFTPPGGRVSVRLTAEGDEVAIAVVDTGIGISPADLQGVFDEFVQAEGTVERREQGTGLGLALARRFVELHRGRLTADSVVGAGSTFTVHLPTKGPAD